MAEKQFLTIHETALRCKEQGIPVSEYAIRMAVQQGILPVGRLGRTQIVNWNKFLIAIGGVMSDG